MITYRLGEVVRSRLVSPALPAAYGPEGEPVRPLIRESDDEVVCYVRSTAGPYVVGSLTRAQTIELYGEEIGESL